MNIEAVNIAWAPCGVTAPSPTISQSHTHCVMETPTITQGPCLRELPIPWQTNGICPQDGYQRYPTICA